jgi:glycosyltransferase involved in cell wall biosynthesis
MDCSASTFGLPLVSIVITSYNYAQFLDDAVNSALTQSYSRIECLIVDDASTDNTPAVLEHVRQRAPDVKILRHAVNRGQLAAFETGYAASSGEYVVFLDADDMLLPSFVESHVFVHLSSRAPVGFTSSDMLQTRGARVVTSSWGPLSRYVASGRGSRENLLRPIDQAAPDLWSGVSACLRDIGSRVHLVEPTPEWGLWTFAPTSGNCFRRDALDLMLRDADFSETRCYGDTYLNRGISMLCGAILIDVPLTIYRLHERNGFANQPELLGIYGYDLGQATRGDHRAWLSIVDRFAANGGRLIERIGVERYGLLLAGLQRASGPIAADAEVGGLTRYIEDKLREREPSLRAQIGSSEFDLLIARIARARRRSGGRRRWPRPGLKQMAEFLMTAGRALGAKPVSSAGEWLWRL